MEHQDITHIYRTGYPPGMEEPKFIEYDSRDYEIYEDDEFYSINDKKYLAETLLLETKEILEDLGAIKTSHSAKWLLKKYRYLIIT